MIEDSQSLIENCTSLWRGWFEDGLLSAVIGEELKERFDERGMVGGRWECEGFRRGQFVAVAAYELLLTQLLLLVR